jgi:putative iron-regulated protein
LLNYSNAKELILNVTLTLFQVSKYTRSLLLAALCLMLTACDQFFEPKKEAAPAKMQIKINSQRLLSATNIYAYTQLSEALNQAQILDGLITSLLHHPNPMSLEEAQNTWLKAYQAYLQVSFFHSIPRFEKPQHHENGDTYHLINEQLDTWPIEAGYIDYLPQYPLSGIINDMTLKITEQDVLQQHGFSDRRFASVGFHPLEFLLFGMNGTRSAKDFIPQENSIETIGTDMHEKAGDADDEAQDDSSMNYSEHQVDMEEQHTHAELENLGPQNHNRRREFLRILSALIVKNLQTLADRWEPAHGYYAKQWNQPEQHKNLQKIYQVSMDTLHLQLLNNHIHPLLSEADMDDLRSPFSQQDGANMLAIMQGIETLFNVENGFIQELKTHHAETADKITAQFKRLLRDMKNIPPNVATLSLKQRQKIIAPVQKKLVTLITHLYAGAQVMGLPLNPLPVSTN